MTRRSRWVLLAVALVAAGCPPASPSRDVAMRPAANACKEVVVQAPWRNVSVVGKIDVSHSVAVSHDGTSVVYVRPTAKGGQIVVAQADGSDARALTDGTADVRDPVFDHEDGRIVFASNGAGSYDLWSVSVEGGVATRLTQLPGDERHPDVSPLGYEVVHDVRIASGGRRKTTLARYHRIVFEHCQGGACQVADVATDGSGPGEVTDSRDGSCGQPRWAPSGRELAYVCDGNLHWVERSTFRRGDLPWRGDAPHPELSWPDAADWLPAKAPNPEYVGRIGVFEGFERPVISPNGLWVLAERGEGEARQLWALRRDGKSRRQLTRGGAVTDAGWSRDGKRAFFVAGAKDRQLCVADSDLPLSDVANLWAFPELYDVARGDVLARNRFAVFDEPPDSSDRWSDYPQETPGAPSVEPFDRGDLITSDFVLDVMHWAFDGAFMQIERDALAPRLGQLLAGLYPLAADAYARTTDASDYRLAVLVGVAKALASSDGLPDSAPALSGRGTGHRKVKEGVSRTLKTVRAGMTSPASERVLAELGTHTVDLSELKPRGHYDRDGLRGYFRAMMWLSRVRLESADAALTAYRWLQKGGLYAAYAELYQHYELLVGSAEDAGLTVFADIAVEHPEWFGPKLAREPIVAEAKGRLTQGPTLAISAQRHFYIFPSRWTPDAAVMQQLSFSNRGRPPRGPSSLDVMAVLGSPRAALHAPEQQGFPYAQTLAELRALSPTLFRGDGAYGSWLLAMQTLLVRDPAQTRALHLPEFARTPAYRDKLLHTALASYAALKHDTLLAAKPPRVRMGAMNQGDEYLYEMQVLPRRSVFVEPTPGLYERLTLLTERVRDALRIMGPATADVAKRFERAREGLLSPLQRALAAQLQGKPVSDELNEQLVRLRGYMHGGHSEGVLKAIVGPDVPGDGPCLVADIWSQPERHRLRAIAIGDMMPMAAVFDDDGRNVITVGEASSFYQLDLPMHERPTDRQWCERVRSSHPPPRPAWTTSFIQPHR